MKILVYTLSATEVNVRHTGINLKRLILQELEKYGVNSKQIYSITSDNGSNFVKAVELIEAENNDDDNDDELLENDVTDDDLQSEIDSYDWKSLNIMGEHKVLYSLCCMAQIN